MGITTEEVTEVNRKLGGSLRSDSSLKFAEAQCKNIASSYRRASIWVRAIIIDHPFTDANKRTALYVVDKLVNIKDLRKAALALERIALKNTISLKKIQEVLENANRRKEIRKAEAVV